MDSLLLSVPVVLRCGRQGLKLLSEPDGGEQNTSPSLITHQIQTKPKNSETLAWTKCDLHIPHGKMLNYPFKSSYTVPKQQVAVKHCNWIVTLSFILDRKDLIPQFSFSFSTISKSI